MSGGYDDVDQVCVLRLVVCVTLVKTDVFTALYSVPDHDGFAWRVLREHVYDLQVVLTGSDLRLEVWIVDADKLLWTFVRIVDCFEILSAVQCLAESADK